MTPPNPHPYHPAMSEQVRGGVAPAGLSVADVLRAEVLAVVNDMGRMMPSATADWRDRLAAALSASAGDQTALRDWFAGQFIMGWRHSSVTHTHEHIAQEAYRTADAMLAARSAAESARAQVQA